MELKSIQEVIGRTRDELDVKLVNRFGTDEGNDSLFFYLDMAFDILEENFKEAFKE